MMKIDFFFFVLWLAAACTFSNKEVKKNSKQEPSDTIALDKVVKDTVYSKSRFNLTPDIYLEVEITKIELIERKNYFISYPHSEFSIPDTFSGFEPIISLKVTNINNEEFNAPTDRTFYLRSDDPGFESLPHLFRNRQHQYYRMDSNQIQNKDGKIIYGTRFKGLKVFNFKPFESKDFKVSFNPLSKYITNIKFGDFRLDKKEIWFFIDLKEKKVTGKGTIFDF